MGSSVACIKLTTSEKTTGSNDLQDLVVVTLLGMFLRLRDLKLAEFAQKLLAKDMSSKALTNVRFERANVGRLRENALSCMLVRKDRCANMGAYVVTKRCISCLRS